MLDFLKVLQNHMGRIYMGVPLCKMKFLYIAQK
jgi:hypothetical protein